MYFLDIYKVEGGGSLGGSTRATRTIAKDANYTVNRNDLINFKQIASVNHSTPLTINESYNGSYRLTQAIGLSSHVLNNSAYSAELRQYIQNTAQAMKVKLTNFYGYDQQGYLMYRHVLFNNHANDVEYSGEKLKEVPGLPTGTKCALVYGLTATDSANYGVDLPANKGSITAKGTSTSVKIHDIKWASGQDGGNYVLYGFNETCGISVAAHEESWLIPSWFFKSAKLYAAPKDTREPALLGVAPMATSEFNDGDKVIIALVFDEIIYSADNVSLTTTLSNDPFILKGGIGTNILYFEGTVSGYGASAPTKDNILINNSENIKDML